MQLNKEIMLFAPWIDGEAVSGDESFQVLNPANNSCIASVFEASEHHAEQAVISASAAFSVWSTMFPRDRARILERWAELIVINKDDLAAILTSENGKVLSEAKGELLHAADAIRWSAQSLLREHGETLPNHSATQKLYTIKQALGVVACITPWNFPAAAVLVKVSAALAAGCTVIVKPSEETPLIALALARLSLDAGLPKGAMNILPCSKPDQVARVLCSDENVRMISFTGSTKTGKKIYEASSQTIKRLALELGGNSAFIVCADADIDKAVDDAVNARFYNAGQICVGANRFYVHESVYSDFEKKFKARILSLKVGPGFDEATDIGPLINRTSKRRLQALVKDALDKGAQCIVGAAEENADTLFFSPTLLVNVNRGMRVHNEEIFGPIACLYTFSADDEAVRLANSTEAGLVSYVYSQDIAKLMFLSEQLEAGVVGANSTAVFSNDLPFGGIKQSGLGREHGLSHLDEFLVSKSICLELNYKGNT